MPILSYPTCTLLSRVLPETIELKFSMSQDPCTALADRGLLERAIVNLVINARDAMPKGGKLTIESANVELDGDFIAERQENVEPGRYAMIAVTDTGIGIPKTNLEKVFEPFFSTKLHSNGTGLGLSMVLGFAKKSSGFVRVYSEEGHGTSIKIFCQPPIRLSRHHRSLFVRRHIHWRAFGCWWPRMSQRCGAWCCKS
jgi:signal transduction histidine kinase